MLYLFFFSDSGSIYIVRSKTFPCFASTIFAAIFQLENCLTKVWHNQEGACCGKCAQRNWTCHIIYRYFSKGKKTLWCFSIYLTLGFIVQQGSMTTNASNIYEVDMSLFILLLAPFFSLKTFTSIAFRLSYMHVYRPDQQITEPDKDNMLRFEVVINSLYYIPYFSFYFHTFSHFPSTYMRSG